MPGGKYSGWVAASRSHTVGGSWISWVSLVALGQPDQVRVGGDHAGARDEPRPVRPQRLGPQRPDDLHVPGLAEGGELRERSPGLAPVVAAFNLALPMRA